MTNDTRARIETVAGVQGRQTLWVEWMARATEGLAPTDHVITVTRLGGILGNFLLAIAKERQCPTCLTTQGVDEFSEDPAPIEERQCNECLQAYVNWNDENDPDAIEENWKRDVAEAEEEAPSRELVEQLRQEWIASHGPAERIARKAYQDARDARLAARP